MQHYMHLNVDCNIVTGEEAGRHCCHIMRMLASDWCAVCVLPFHICFTHITYPRGERMTHKRMLVMSLKCSLWAGRASSWWHVALWHKRLQCEHTLCLMTMWTHAMFNDNGHAHTNAYTCELLLCSYRRAFTAVLSVISELQKLFAYNPIGN